MSKAFLLFYITNSLKNITAGRTGASEYRPVLLRSVVYFVLPRSPGSLIRDRADMITGTPIAVSIISGTMNQPL